MPLERKTDKGVEREKDMLWNSTQNAIEKESR